MKPSFVIDPRREVEVYRRLLAPAGIGAPLVGSCIDPATDSYWLLLEYVSGPRLFEVDAPFWPAAAHWLGRLHARLATIDTASLQRSGRLIACDRQWYRIWMDRAQRFCLADSVTYSRHDRGALRWLADRYDSVIDRLLALPCSIIHGEFYPSNVIMNDATEDVRPCALDWEMTSIGPGVLDLAALMAGEWGDDDCRDMTAAYQAGAGGHTTIEDLAEAARYAHVHIAVQWLGWFGRRRPPGLHARNWLKDAVEHAETLDL